MKTLAGALLVVLAAAGCSGDDSTDFTDVSLDTANCGPPAATCSGGPKGVQFQTPAFDVPQGEEVQDCYFFTMPDLNNGQPYWVDRVRLGSNPGSHHANVFRVNTIVALGRPEDGDFVHNGECFKSGNWADWPLVTNNQNSNPNNGYFDWKLPTGVAYKFSPGERIMVQTHYVNATTQKTAFKGKVVLDFYKSSMANPVEMGTLFATQQSIRICQSQPNVSYTGGCSFNTGGKELTIAAANGHFHSRGTKFDVYHWDGMTTAPPAAADLFYESTRWDDPPMTIYDNAANMKIPANGGVRWTCEYKWIQPDAGCDAVNMRDKLGANDCCYTFGPVVETSEHCNVFLYYYPKVERGDIACF